MERTKPTSVVTLAILHFIGGGLGLCFGLFGMAMQAAQSFAPKPPAQSSPGIPGSSIDPEKLKQAMEDGPAYRAMMIAFGGADLILSVMLLAGGFGLLKLQPWGRTLSLVYAPLSIATRTCACGYMYIFPIGAAIKYLDGLPKQAGPDATAISIAKVGLYVIPLMNFVFIIYPLVVLLVLTRAKVVAAFRPAGDAGMEAPA